MTKRSSAPKTFNIAVPRPDHLAVPRLVGVSDLFAAEREEAARGGFESTGDVSDWVSRQSSELQAHSRPEQLYGLFPSLQSKSAALV